MISGHLCLQALQAKMCCNAYHDRFLHDRFLQLGNIKGGSLLVESVLWISRRTKSSFFLLSLAVLCRFVFFYISFVSWRLPRLTVFRLSKKMVRKPELFFISTLCVLSNVSHLHSEEEGNHLLGWDELFWKEENHTNNLSSIQMFYCKYIRFWYLMLCSILLLVFDRWRNTIFNQKWDNSIFKSLWEYGNKW